MIVGLTGNIGSGKSTVLKRVAQLGAKIIDTDMVAREVVEPGTPGLQKLIREFGTGILDGSGHLDRSKLGSIVFDNPKALRHLESIVHPEVHKVVTQHIKEYQMGETKAPALVIEVPLLIETDMHRLMDEIWLVTVDRESQIKRVAARSGMTREEVIKRISFQMPQEEKVRYANRLIDNSGTEEETIRQVDAIWSEINENIPLDPREKPL